MTIILVAEGESPLRTVIRTALAKIQGSVIAEAIDGRDAIAKLRILSPGVVITGASLPHIDGVALTRRIRAEKSAEELPVFLLAGIHEKEKVQRGLAAGANGYFTKPPDTVRLVTVVGRYVK